MDRILRTGSPWRDLPQAFGDWNSVFPRALLPADVEPQGGLAADLSRRCPDDPDFEYLIIDSTIVPGASARRRGEKKGLKIKPLGRSRGGLSTKIHMAVRGLRRMVIPVRFTLTAEGQGR